MKYCITLIFIVFTNVLLAQDKLYKISQEIVQEAELLYRSEKASWHGTDLFLKIYKEKEKIGGYFSYSINDTNRCVFYSKDEIPKVVGEVNFDSTFNIQTAISFLTIRPFTSLEKDLYIIRLNSEKLMSIDTTFIRYQNTNFNIIPIIIANEKRVYVLTGTQTSGFVPLGNDYLITFNSNHKITKINKLHNNYIPIQFGEIAEISYHFHLENDSEYITATDICTLMLYRDFTKWKKHIVYSDKTVCIWDYETFELQIVTKKEFKKANKELAKLLHKEIKKTSKK